MKYNYPIKYAAMPIIEQVGWQSGMNELEREYGIVCYIVSKCYLISNIKKYNENGQVNQEYEVVFPYQFTDNSKWQRITSTYNLINGYCTNSNKVAEVFDTYAEAHNYASIKNDKLCELSWIDLPYSKDIMEKIQQKKDEFRAKLTSYKLLEHQIELNTDDMKICQMKKSNYTIKKENNKLKIIPYNIYEVLKLYNNENFVVYSISQKQYDEINNGTSANVVNSQSILWHQTKDNGIQLVAAKDKCIYSIKNNNLCIGSKIDKTQLLDLEYIDKDTSIFYTTETLEDIINSYKTHKEIDLVKNQCSKLQRKK